MKVKDTIKDAKFNEFLGYEIESYTKLRPAPEKGYRYRRTPYDSLNDAGLFTVDGIKSEFEKIANRESRLSKNQRDAVVGIVLRTASSVVTYRKQKESKAEQEQKALQSAGRKEANE